MYITPRTLLGIIRISQAIAKFHFRDHVEQADVDRAIKLMDFSIRSLRKFRDDDEKKNRRAETQERYQDHMSKIISDVRTVMMDKRQMNVNEIQKKLQMVNPIEYSGAGKGGGQKRDQLLDTLNFYKKLNIVFMDDEQNVIFL